MSKAINELIKKYQLEIRNIKLEITKLERERDRLQEVIMDLEELENEESIFVLKKPNLENPPKQQPTKPSIETNEYKKIVKKIMKTKKELENE